MVKIYTTKICKYCKIAKDYFKSKNIPFEEINVTERREEAQKALDATGSFAVPIIEIDGKFMTGFNKFKVNELLGI